MQAHICVYVCVCVLQGGKAGMVPCSMQVLTAAELRRKGMQTHKNGNWEHSFGQRLRHYLLHRTAPCIRNAVREEKQLLLLYIL